MLLCPLDICKCFGWPMLAVARSVACSRLGGHWRPVMLCAKPLGLVQSLMLGVVMLVYLVPVVLIRCSPCFSLAATLHRDFNV